MNGHQEEDASLFRKNHREKDDESASSPSVGFGWLNDNMIKGLTRLLSVDR